MAHWSANKEAYKGIANQSQLYRKAVSEVDNELSKKDKVIAQLKKDVQALQEKYDLQSAGLHHDLLVEIDRLKDELAEYKILAFLKVTNNRQKVFIENKIIGDAGLADLKRLVNF